MGARGYTDHVRTSENNWSQLLQFRFQESNSGHQAGGRNLCLLSWLSLKPPTALLLETGSCYVALASLIF